jgi:hypothetical protein
LKTPGPGAPKRCTATEPAESNEAIGSPQGSCELESSSLNFQP